MPPKHYDNGAKWEAQHDIELIRSMINLILSNRPTLYVTPGLAEVANNRGDRINKRTQAILTKLEAAFPGAEGLVKEESTRISGTKPWKRQSKGEGEGEESGGASSTPSPTKKARGRNSAVGKNGGGGVKAEADIDGGMVKEESE